MKSFTIVSFFIYVKLSRLYDFVYQFLEAKFLKSMPNTLLLDIIDLSNDFQCLVDQTLRFF